MAKNRSFDGGPGKDMIHPISCKWNRNDVLNVDKKKCGQTPNKISGAKIQNPKCRNRFAIDTCRYLPVACLLTVYSSILYCEYTDSL